MGNFYLTFHSIVFSGSLSEHFNSFWFVSLHTIVKRALQILGFMASLETLCRQQYRNVVYAPSFYQANAKEELGT